MSLTENIGEPDKLNLNFAKPGLFVDRKDFTVLHGDSGEIRVIREELSIVETVQIPP